jgi:hypothetical protein
MLGAGKLGNTGSEKGYPVGDGKAGFEVPGAVD